MILHNFLTRTIFTKASICKRAKLYIVDILKCYFLYMRFYLFINIFLQVRSSITDLSPTLYWWTPTPKLRFTKGLGEFEKGTGINESEVRLIDAFHKNLLEPRTEKRKGSSQRGISEIQFNQRSAQTTQ